MTTHTQLPSLHRGHRPPFTYADRWKAADRGHLGDSRREYVRFVDGSIRRTYPARPWYGKSDRRRVIKARREARTRVTEVA